jgi:CheY-like chemotaxis protein
MARPVLVAVDDDEQELQLLRRDLERGYGDRYRVVTASSGREALETLRRLKLDHETVALLLADQGMPELTGVDVLERAVAFCPAAKRALLTTYPDAEAAIKAIKTVRIDHYLMKPWQPPEQNLYPALNDLLAAWETCSLPPAASVRVVGYRFSAGQAALHFARYARTVTMLVRGESLSKSMSQYLVEQIEETKNVRVRLRTTVVEVHGGERLEAITVLDVSSGTKELLPTNALFIFIGAVPHTEWFGGIVERDSRGFVLTGADLARSNDQTPRPQSWPLEREPFWLESSVPGVFAAGDVRHGSVKRVAAGVGEGATAVQFIHQYLNSTRQTRS